MLDQKYHDVVGFAKPGRTKTRKSPPKRPEIVRLKITKHHPKIQAIAQVFFRIFPKEPLHESFFQPRCMVGVFKISTNSSMKITPSPRGRMISFYLLKQLQSNNVIQKRRCSAVFGMKQLVSAFRRLQALFLRGDDFYFGSFSQLFLGALYLVRQQTCLKQNEVESRVRCHQLFRRDLAKVST